MSQNKPDYESCFKSAFAMTVAGIEGANSVPVENLFNAINNNLGNSRSQAKALLGCLGVSNWRWGAYDGQLETEKDYKQMAKSMASSVELMAHQLYRRQQLLAVTDRRPFWQFKAGDNDSTPQQCLSNDRVTKNFQASFWQGFFPPCGRTHCSCHVESLTPREVEIRAKNA